MNPNGRVVGGVLIGVAMLWLLRSVGALPFSDRSNNQVATNSAAAQLPPDRPPIDNFNATRTGIGAFNPGTGTQDFGIPGTGSGNSSAIAQTPRTTTTGTPGTTTSQSSAPAVRAGW